VAFDKLGGSEFRAPFLDECREDYSDETPGSGIAGQARVQSKVVVAESSGELIPVVIPAMIGA
jgi:hypothetical protein